MMRDPLTYGRYSTSVAQLQIKIKYFWLFLHALAMDVCVGICGHVAIT